MSPVGGGKSVQYLANGIICDSIRHFDRLHPCALNQVPINSGFNLVFTSLLIQLVLKIRQETTRQVSS